MEYDLAASLYTQMKLDEAVEGDINRVAKQYPDIHKDIIKQYADQADPKTDKGSRYIDWLVKGHSSGAHGTEDTPRLKDALYAFEKHKSKLANKDINQYKHISEVEDAVLPHLGTLSKTASRDPNNFLENPDHREKVYDNGKGLQVFNTKTEAASKAIYGGGHALGGTHTSWCTASDSANCRFKHYSKDGANPLYQIHTPDGKVYQDEFSGDFSGGLRDARDNTVKRSDLVKDHPDLTKVPAFQGKDLAYSGDEHIGEALHSEIKKDGNSDYATVISHPKLDASHISSIIAKGNGWRGPTAKQLSTVMEHPAFNSTHVKDMIAMETQGGNHNKVVELLNHPKADVDSLTHLSDMQFLHSDVAKAVVNHPKFNDSHVTQILNVNGQTAIKTELLNTPNISKETVDKAISHEDVDTRALGITHPLATDTQREHVLENDKNIRVRQVALRSLKSPDLIEKHLDKENTNNVNEYTNHQAISNMNANASTIRKAFPHLTAYSRRDAVAHKNAPADVISEHLKTANSEDKIAALKAPNINVDHLAQAIGDKDHLVKQAVLRHPKATKEQIDAHIDNPSMHGSISVSKGAKPEHLESLSSSAHIFIRKNVAENKNTSKDTLTKLSADEDSSVKESALKSLSKKK